MSWSTATGEPMTEHHEDRSELRARFATALAGLPLWSSVRL